MTSHPVELLHQGQTYQLEVPEDQTILNAAIAAGIDLPSSCLSGVCTSCAAQILSGDVYQPDAMGLGPGLAEKGYSLLCAAYPRSALRIESSKEDQVYEEQFGQFQN